jgi:hypothetical protein
MRFFNPRGQRHGHGLGISGACETAHADGIAVFDKGGGFFGAGDTGLERLMGNTRRHGDGFSCVCVFPAMT